MNSPTGSLLQQSSILTLYLLITVDGVTVGVGVWLTPGVSETETVGVTVAVLVGVLVGVTVGVLVGDAVTFVDLNGTFQTNNLTVDRNGNEIMNLAEDMTATINHAAFTLVYTGAINGWKLLEVA